MLPKTTIIFTLDRDRDREKVVLEVKVTGEYTRQVIGRYNKQ